MDTSYCSLPHTLNLSRHTYHSQKSRLNLLKHWSVDDVRNSISGQTLSSTHHLHLSKSHAIILFLKPEIDKEMIVEAFPNIKKLLPASRPTSPHPTAQELFSFSQILASVKDICNTFRRCITFYFTASVWWLPQSQPPRGLTSTTTALQCHCFHYRLPPTHFQSDFLFYGIMCVT